MVYVYLSFFMTVYLSWAWPFDTKSLTIVETFNEYVVFLIGLHELVLLGFIDDFTAKRAVGDSMVFCILFMLLLNVIIVFRDFFG